MTGLQQLEFHRKTRDVNVIGLWRDTGKVIPNMLAPFTNIHDETQLFVCVCGCTWIESCPVSNKHCLCLFSVIIMN